MLAVLLATGESQKLRPLTEYMPSPMIPLVGRPVMSFMVEMLAQQGFKQILISLHSQPGAIEAYFGTGRRWGVNLEYILQREAWGTAGALRWIKSSLNGTFLVLPTDIFIELDLRQLAEQHCRQPSIATVVVKPNAENPSRVLYKDTNGMILGSQPDSHGSEACGDTGVYIFEPEILDLIPACTRMDIHSDLLPGLSSRGRSINSCSFSGYWNELDTFEQYQKAQQFVLNGAWKRHEDHNSSLKANLSGFEGQQNSRGIWIGKNSTVHPGVRLTPPVYIGDQCWIGRDVELGPSAVIGSNSLIDDQASIYQSTILDQTYIGRLTNIRNRLVDRNLVVDFGTGESVRIADRHLMGQAKTFRSRDLVEIVFEKMMASLLFLAALPVMVVLTALLWLAAGKAFTYQTRLKPDRNRIDEQGKVVASTFHLFQFFVPSERSELASWLARWDLYRLPELWNVIKGDLRLVGVRPIAPDETREFIEEWQQKPFEVQPGFTGLWYVQDHFDRSPDDVLVTDAYYAATRTWWQDLRLLWKTPFAWLRRGLNRRAD